MNLRTFVTVDNIVIVLSSAILSSVLTFIFYPGIILSDDYYRWVTALYMSGAEDRPFYWAMTTWYPPVGAWLKSLTYRISGEFGLYTWLHGFFYYLAMFLVAKKLFGRPWFWLFALITLLIPPIWMSAIAESSHNVTTIGLLFLAYLLSTKVEAFSRGVRVLHLIAFLAVVFITLGTRHNTLVVFPIIIAAIFYIYRAALWRLLSLVSVACIILLIQFMPDILNVRRVPVLTATVVWEHAGILKILEERGEPDAISTYSMDAYGDTRRAIDLHENDQHGSIVLSGAGGGAPMERTVLFENKQAVYTNFINLVRHHPYAFVENRFNFYSHLLGFKSPPDLPLYWDISCPYIATVYDIDYKREPDSLAIQLEVYSAELARESWLRWIYKPWAFLSLTLLLLALSYKTWKREPIVILLLSLSVVYYGSFFIISPGVLSFYYLPTFTISLLLILKGIKGLINIVTNILCRRTKQ